ncbi:ABC transporter ATP-binding protein [Paenibacillus albiflavus]|uniref:ABC transporter ATP-binding protein n=1 Tax=Paenibacillus albiflavus TaxID=2545760 RepID=A0A4R4ENY6_9BACL|nr:ABC transporter ATP-binding protein [Paenibacillus albiflavus]TCZ80078.1 ABC transporter ATP-binding protein [Paenibacillus albiflavus]
MEETAIIQFHHVNYTFEEEQSPFMCDLNFQIKQGEWVSVVGESGSGKSTLCQLIAGTKPADTSQDGGIWINGKQRTEMETEREHAIGMVMQDPDAQIIQSLVEDELAFGPENLRVERNEILNRIESALSEVGLSEYRLHSTNELSGGQKQRIAIASVLTMNPNILILDDAIASLDRPAIEQFRETLLKLKRQGLTIINASTRLDPLDQEHGDRLIVLEQGRIIANGPTPSVMISFKEKLIRFGCIPDNLAENTQVISEQMKADDRLPLLEIKNLTYQYPVKGKQDLHQKPLLNGINYQLYAGELVALVGANGSGKTTLGKLIAGLLPAPQDSIWLHGQEKSTYSTHEFARKIGYVFQNPEHQFIADTLLEECVFGLKIAQGYKPWQLTPASILAEGERVLAEFGLLAYKHKHPFVLSKGEQRLLSVASAILLQPELILLDEPTAGLDYASMTRLMEWCTDYKKQGHSILMITHDLEYINSWLTHTWKIENYVS